MRSFSACEVCCLVLLVACLVSCDKVPPSEKAQPEVTKSEDAKKQTELWQFPKEVVERSVEVVGNVIGNDDLRIVEKVLLDELPKHPIVEKKLGAVLHKVAKGELRWLPSAEATTVFRRGVAWLGALGTQESLNQLLALIGKVPEEYLKGILWNIYFHGKVSDEIRRKLFNDLCDHPEPEVRRAVIVGLGKSGTLKQFKKMFEDRDESVVAQAWIFFDQLEGEKADRLRESVASASDSVQRYFATLQLYRRKKTTERKMFDAMAALMRTTVNASLLGRALADNVPTALRRALADSVIRDYIGLLPEENKYDENSSIVFYLPALIGESTNAEAVSVLEAAIDKNNLNVRAGAVKALVQNRRLDPERLNALLERIWVKVLKGNGSVDVLLGVALSYSALVNRASKEPKVRAQLDHLFEMGSFRFELGALMSCNSLMSGKLPEREENKLRQKAISHSGWRVKALGVASLALKDPNASVSHINVGLDHRKSAYRVLSAAFGIGTAASGVDEKKALEVLKATAFAPASPFYRISIDAPIRLAQFALGLTKESDLEKTVEKLLERSVADERIQAVASIPALRRQKKAIPIVKKLLSDRSAYVRWEMARQILIWTQEKWLPDRKFLLRRFLEEFYQYQFSGFGLTAHPVFALRPSQKKEREKR